MKDLDDMALGSTLASTHWHSIPNPHDYGAPSTPQLLSFDLSFNIWSSPWPLTPTLTIVSSFDTPRVCLQSSSPTHGRFQAIERREETIRTRDARSLNPFVQYLAFIILALDRNLNLRISTLHTTAYLDTTLSLYPRKSVSLSNST